MARGNVLSALAPARDLPQLSLVDALELTVLVAREDPRRHPRVAARWLLRLLEEQPDVMIEEAALAAASLVALTGGAYGRRGRPLQAMAETAASRRRAPQHCVKARARSWKAPWRSARRPAHFGPRL